MLTICLLILLGSFLITPAIETKVESILDSWFGAEYTIVA